MNLINIEKIVKAFTESKLFDNASFSLQEGEKVGVIGINGTGKTTLLKTIAGLIPPVKGHVSIDGVYYRTSKRNPVYMMHQRYSNFNWLTCLDNVLIAQRDKKLRDSDEAMKVLAAVGLDQYTDKWPSQLSGGMQQRLALARTLYVQPKYLLMDEPLSALDDKTRSSMQRLILDVHAVTQNTIIMVTHSQDEAFKMCDDIIEFEAKGVVVDHGKFT